MCRGEDLYSTVQEEYYVHGSDIDYQFTLMGSHSWPKNK